MQSAEARIPPEDSDDLPPLETSNTPATGNAGAGAGAGLGGMADMLRNMNMGGGAGGGMPDLASLMSNPAMAQMAQQMMANGGMERLMSNPAVANMVSGPLVFVKMRKQSEGQLFR